MSPLREVYFCQNQGGYQDTNFKDGVYLL